MNDLLELKGELQSSKFDGPVVASWPKYKSITCEEIDSYISDLKRLNNYWKDKSIISGVLISVYYNRVIPKSSRIKGLFSKGSEHSNSYVKGVKFSSLIDKKHIVTYYISKEILLKSIQRLQSVRLIISENFDGIMNYDQFEIVKKQKKLFDKYNISKSAFQKYIKDLLDIEKFDLYENNDDVSDDNLYITLFDTNTDISEVMNKIGIKNTDYEIFSNDTIYVKDISVLLKIRQVAPYIISMAMTDLATYYQESENKIDFTTNFSDMPNPTIEPTIGVIDTLFDKSVYFEKWVDYRDELNKDLPRNQKDYIHGTEVSSIIVDGARSNKKWDDECGFFKVRHFGVAKEGVNNSFDIITKIKQIVKANTDIHVWNISLGSKFEINQNYISPEAAALDEIQYENNVVFVVAGTNKNNDSVVRIGAPADSINSIVVNAVDKNFKKASYARKGKVLSFFVKPDVCAFGGDSNEFINVCTPTGLDIQRGTSFAAPWISRKLCYLIDKMGLSREIAKALIIDSAVGWKKTNPEEEYLGYGVVPTKISDVMLGKKDEIKFYIEGNATSYYTYTYNLPVPLVNDKFPFYAKAVLCYFPKCTRSQGVDYTNTELDLQFGRIGQKDIKSINRNTQGGELDKATNEATARDLYRKWDNVKVVVDEIKDRKVPRTSYNNSNLWGIKLTNKERLDKNDGLKFGIVITLKEMYGKNRIREFIDLCTMRNWIVNKINIDNRLEIYNTAEEIIEFE